MTHTTIVQLLIALVLLIALALVWRSRNDGDGGTQFANGCVFWLIVLAVVIDALVYLARNLRWRA